MQADVSRRIGAERYAHTPERTAYRNGARPRRWDARAGTLDLRIPKLREGFSRIGAYYYRARFYSTALGRFMSADSMTADGLDRYAYVRNNPLRYADPSARALRVRAVRSSGPAKGRTTLMR